MDGTRTPHRSISEKNRTTTQSTQNDEKSIQNHSVADLHSHPLDQIDALSTQNPDTSLHKNRATCVQQDFSLFPDNLLEIIEAWEHLPEMARVGILEIVRKKLVKFSD